MRSSTLAFQAFSRLRCCTGDSAQSITTMPASSVLTMPASSSTLPLPRRSPAGRRASGTTPDRTTSRSIARARPTASSSRASGERNASRARASAPPGACRADAVRRRSRVRCPSLSARSGDQRACRTGGAPIRPCLRRRLFGPFEQLDRMTRHDRRDRVLVDELRMPVAAQQHAEIVEPGHDALQLHAVDQEDGERSFALADVIEEGVLQIL